MNNRFQGGPNQLVQAVIPLGTGAVSTQTKIIGAVPKNMRVTAIKFYPQAAATATALTAQVFARTAAGATGNDLCADTSIDVADAATGKAGVSATLESTNPEHLNLDRGQLLEVVVTADTVSAGPGDVLVAVEYEPTI